MFGSEAGCNFFFFFFFLNKQKKTLPIEQNPSVSKFHLPFNNSSSE